MLAAPCLVVLLAGCAIGAVQNAARPDSGYLPDTEYVYSYSSLAQLSMGLNLSVQAEVTLAVVSDAETSTELVLSFSEPLILWTGSSGTHMDPTALGDLTHWFSILKDLSGGVSEAYYDSTDTSHVLAYKKSIAGMFSVDMQAGERIFDGDSLMIHVKSPISLKGGPVKTEEKKAVYDRNGLLSSVEVMEVIASESASDKHGFLLATPISSNSKLVLIEHHESFLSMQRPSDFVSASLFISKPKIEVPLGKVRSEIEEKLSCAANRLNCMSELIKLLWSLSDADLEALSVEYFEPTLPSLMAFPLLDALVRLDSPVVCHVLSLHIITPEHAGTSRELVRRALFHLGTGAIQPTSEVVEAVLTLAMVTEEDTMIYHQSLLILGTLAKQLHYQEPDLYTEIVSILHSLLEQHAGYPHPEALSKSRRSLLLSSLSYDSLRHAVIIDALGNAGAKESVPALVHHTTGNSILSVQYASVNALGQYDSEETATALLKVVDSTPHPALRLSAARAYQAHPRRKRDLSPLLQPTRHSRSHRQVESLDKQVSNVTMPDVSWNSQFGDNNISTDLGRIVHNSFTIKESALTSSYKFSIRDEVSFDASMLLSDREEQQRMLRTEFCLEGEAKYDVNVLTDFNYNLTAYQFEYYSSVVDGLMEAFQEAYDSVTVSENGYAGLRTGFLEALDSLPNRFERVQSLIEDFKVITDDIGTEFRLLNKSISVLTAINTTHADTYQLALASLQAIADAVDALLPSKPSALTSCLDVGGLPFTSSTFYLPYLPFSPQRSMANLFMVYQRCGDIFTDLLDQAQILLSQTDPNGTNFQWLSTSLFLRNEESAISCLLEDLTEAINEAGNSPEETYKSVPLADFVSLQQAVLNLLQPALMTLKSVGVDITEEWRELNTALDGSETAYNLFTGAYEKSRSEIDVVFGQRFNPAFPRKLLSYDSDAASGSYPSTGNGRYQEGIDLVVDATELVVAPLSSYVQSVYVSGVYENTSILVTPAESSFSGIQFIIANIISSGFVSDERVLVHAGSTIGSVDTSYQIFNQTFIHVESYKTIDGTSYTIDATQFLQPNLNPKVDVVYSCNDFITFIGGAVIDRRAIVSTNAQVEHIGTPLVEQFPIHEFPQTYDLVISTATHNSAENVEFFQSNTFLMVGPIPVQFDFAAVGQYQLNYSISVGLLSKESEATIAPYLHARAEGTMTVGSTQFARVEFTGSLVETLLPLLVKQTFYEWPLKASSQMKVVLVPSTLTLLTQLVQRTGIGQFAAEEVLENEHVWEYSIPSLNRDEFYYKGILEDTSAPIILPLNYSSGNQCFVRQLPGRMYANPAFELEYNLEDKQSLLDVSFRVGSFQEGADLIAERRIGGKRIVVPSSLVSGKRIIFTLLAVNQNSLQTLSTCSLPAFDTSPPLARINPIKPFSSHPTKMKALVVLFDENQLNNSLEVAIGSIRGQYGTDVLIWTPLDVTSISTPPDMMGNVMNAFSFPRSGRLVGGILLSVSNVDQVVDCATMCNDDTECKSFDYSSVERMCFLHETIEGPELNSATFNTVFQTPPLQASTSYSHYERLGIGNSTIVEYSGLNFDHNRLYYFNMRLKNSLGYTYVASSSAFLIDFSPPSPKKLNFPQSDLVFADGCNVSVNIPECLEYGGIPNHRVVVDSADSRTIFNGPVVLLDAMFSSASNYIAANWRSFDDSETGIHGFTWCIGTSIGACDILPFTDPHARLDSRDSWTNTGLAPFEDLSDGIYFVTVQAVNNVEFGGPLATTVQHRTSYIVDTTPPILAGVEFVSYNSSTNQLTVVFNASDIESGIMSVSIALGRTREDTSVMGWREVSTNGEGREASLMVHIDDGVPTWVKVRATNQAGLQTIAITSNSPVLVDRSPPIIGYISDGMNGDIDFQSNLTRICMNGGFEDPETAITEVQWGIGVSPGLFDIQQLRALTLQELTARAACEDDLNLSTNVTYYSTIMVMNGATLSVTLSSDGVHTDTTLPIGGYLNAGLNNEVSQLFSSSLTSVSANWGGFYDDESNILHYVVGIEARKSTGTSFDRVRSGQIENSHQSITWNYFSFENGDTIRITLEAVNGAGLSLSMSSEFVIDTTPPELVYILDGLNRSQDSEYQSDPTSLSVVWSANDNQSNIALVEVSVFELSEGRRHLVYPNQVITNDSTAWHNNGLSLQSGLKYVITLILTNGAGLKVQYETNGVIIDTSPPVVGSVLVMSDTYESSNSASTIVNSNLIEVSWSASDLESGVLSYAVGLVDDNSTIVTVAGENYTNYGLATRGILENMNLISGQTYRVSVVAINLAGISSEPTFSSPFRVAEDQLDAAGYVSSVPGAESIGAFYTEETIAMTAYFAGFQSESCGGIYRYEWAIGDDDLGTGRESILPFTDSGVVVEGTSGSGYAQVLLPDLGDRVGQPLFITIRGITGCDEILETTSAPVTVDQTAPFLNIIESGQLAVEQYQSLVATTHKDYQNTAGFSTVWEAMDKDSGVGNTVLVKIGSFPGGSNIESERPVMENYIRSSIMSIEGLPSYITVSANNRAGSSTTVSSEPLVLDTSPSLAGELTCSTHSFSEESSMASISCTWKGVLDPESGITTYAISIGDTPGGQSVIDRINFAGDTIKFDSPLFRLSEGTGYYSTLYATNGAGIESSTLSNVFYIDSNPPLIMGEVFVSSNLEIASYDMGIFVNQSLAETSVVCLSNTKTIGIAFAGTSDQGIHTYEISIGHSPGSTDVQPYQSFKPIVSADEVLFYLFAPTPSLPVTSRKALYFNVKALSNNGLHSVLSSRPVYVKSEANPTANMVYDGINDSFDIDYQFSITVISGSFEIGTSCPLQSVQWLVETVDGIVVQDTIGISISEPADELENHFLVSSDQVNSNETYRIVVQAIDYTGEVYILQSNGSTVTNQAVLPGLVLDGPVQGQDLNFQQSLSTLSAQWSGFGDGSPEQRITRYDVAVGSDRGHLNTRSNIVPFTNVGLNTNYTWNDLDLIPQSTVYYSTVRAYTVSKAFIDATSNGIRVGYGQSIVPGTIMVPRYQSDTLSLMAYWTEFESDLPITSYEWALGSQYLDARELESLCEEVQEFTEGSGSSSLVGAAFNVFGFQVVGQDTSAIAYNLVLQHNMNYYVTIRAVDSGTKCIAAISNAILIDTTPPVPGKQPDVGPLTSRKNIQEGSDYIVYVQPATHLAVSWEAFTDSETELVQYDVGIFEQQICGDMIDVGNSNRTAFMDFRNVGSELTITFESIELLGDIPYIVVVKGTNAVGLSSFVYSQPILLDSTTIMAGRVKDGLIWESDVVFQSDPTKISAIFTHAKLPHGGGQQSRPCPESAFYPLTDFNPESLFIPGRVVGIAFPATVRYDAGQVQQSISPAGVKISAQRDISGLSSNQIITGAYQLDTPVISDGDSVSLDILAASGHSALQEYAVTSVVFIDSGPASDILADYEMETQGEYIAVNAFGMQIHHSIWNDSTGNFTSQRVVVWAKDDNILSSPKVVVRNTALDLSQTHTYTINFVIQQLDINFVRKAELYIDGTIVATLQGLPIFSNFTRMVLHVFNRQGFLPTFDSSLDSPTVEAIFANVSLPSRVNHLCEYGLPFYNEHSPIVEFMAGVGTAPSSTDIEELKTVSFPCTPCLYGPCFNYSCSLNCTLVDPYTIAVDFDNLSLTDYASSAKATSTAGSHLQASVYYVTVEAVSASGQIVLASSNGVILDTTPPEPTQRIEHFDTLFSEKEPIHFQASDHTISAQWGFRDNESGIVEYLWSVGSYPYGDDIQSMEVTGTAPHGVNSSLFGLLQHNFTYYVTVVARNGAGLNTSITSSGVTVLTMELNGTELRRAFLVAFDDVVLVTGENGTVQEVLQAENGGQASVSWKGVSDDVEEIFWFIGSRSSSSDILPRTEVSFNRSTSASIHNDTLFINDVAFANISEIIALAEGKQEDRLDTFAVEPGRLFYHSLELCNLVHVCIIADARPSVVVRAHDVAAEAQNGEDVLITLIQDPLLELSPSILDKEYTVTLETTGGLDPGNRLFAGFLSEYDVSRRYRVNTPYISNPYQTMGRTSPAIARRFTEIGGPSFYVSFLGQESLNGPLRINATYDRLLDWSEAEPELAFWDIDKFQWTEVGATCLTISTIDEVTDTIAVEVCSTVLTSSVERPSSLTRKRRQSTNTTVAFSGDQPLDMLNVTDFLDRPVQFIIIRIGNSSTNTAPQLLLPEDPLQLTEDTIFRQQLKFFDEEGDGADFYLASVPSLGNAFLSQSGLLTYTPCHHCIGMDILEISIIERPAIESIIPFSASGELRLEIVNSDSAPEIAFYLDGTNIPSSQSNSDLIPNKTVYVYVDANHTAPIIVAQVAAFDYDGYNDDLSLFLQVDNGSAGINYWLDAVNTPESLPVSSLPNMSISLFVGYITFVGASISYLPSSANYAGTDEVLVRVRDSRGFTQTITVSIEVLPSYCTNNGICGGSVSDPNCTDIEARRRGFEGYNCSCPSDFEGQYCEMGGNTGASPGMGDEIQSTACPVGIPLVYCDGDPCAGATCPSNPSAKCTPNFCGNCTAVWYDGMSLIDCEIGANNDMCFNRISNSDEHFEECRTVLCDCPELPFNCPDDSIIVEVRHSNCCVSYECVCPNISCPLFMECDKGVQPIPDNRGNNFPGSCCPGYEFHDINECLEARNNMCSDTCVNGDFSYTCSCSSGNTLSKDGVNCGVCPYNGLEYIHSDRVKIGCNWCICREDELSGERWHCTADPCKLSCLFNGMYYSVGSELPLGMLECTCEPTDNGADWNCNQVIS